MHPLYRLLIALFLPVSLGCPPPPPNTALPHAPQGMGQFLIERVTNDSERESGLRASPDGGRLLFNLAASSQARGCGWLDDLRGRCMDDIALEYEQTAIAMIELGRPGKTIVSQENAVDPGWFQNGE